MQVTSILALKGSFVATVPPGHSLADLLHLLGEHEIGAVVVSPDGRQVAGIVSERDIVRALRHGDLTLAVEQVMSSPVTCTTVDRHVDDLMRLMTEQRIRHVPVVDEDEQLVGIVSIGDVVKHRLGELEDEREALIGYITLGG